MFREFGNCPSFFMISPASGCLRGTAGQGGVTEYFPVLTRRGGVPRGRRHSSFWRIEKEEFMSLIPGHFLIRMPTLRSQRLPGKILDLGGLPASGPLRGTAGQEGVTEYFPVLTRRGVSLRGAARILLEDREGGIHELNTWSYLNPDVKLFVHNGFLENIVSGELPASGPL
jgi:hypothetical protein